VNNMSFKLISSLLGLSALTIVSTAMSARAEAPNNDSSFGYSESATSFQPVDPAVTSASVNPLAIDSTSSFDRSQAAAALTQTGDFAVTPVAPIDQLSMQTTVSASPQEAASQPAVPTVQLADINNNQVYSQTQQPTSSDATRVNVAPPMPGTVETSAAALATTSLTAPVPAASSNNADTTVAQTNIDPGRPTRGGYSYIGIGGNIGLGGGSALGDGSFVITSKIGLTPIFSARPGAVLGDETVFLIPVTYDFVIESNDPFSPVPFAPYLGGGVAVTTNGDVGFLLTGGVDVPISRQFVGNAAINVDFGSDTNIGLLLSIGYTFPNLFR
jgi:hypothetical protein